VRLRLPVLDLDAVEPGEVVEARGLVQVSRSEPLLPDRERTLEERNRLRELPGIVEHCGILIQAPGLGEFIADSRCLGQRDRRWAENEAC